MNLAVRTAPEAVASAAQVRVMVCDDSMAIRGAIVRMLETDPAIRVVARAGNGKAAVDELARTPVDVLVLDIEMPVLDGIAALPFTARATTRIAGSLSRMRAIAPRIASESSHTMTRTGAAAGIGVLWASVAAGTAGFTTGRPGRTCRSESPRRTAS